MSQKAPSNLPKDGKGPSVYDRIDQWNGDILPVTNDDRFKIGERATADNTRGAGPSFSDRLVEWNGGVFPETYDDVVAGCWRAKGEFVRGLVPGIGYVAVVGSGRPHLERATVLQGCSGKSRPGVRRASVRISQDNTDERSASAGRDPDFGPESKNPLTASSLNPGTPRISHKPTSWPSSPSIYGDPITSPNAARPPSSLNDQDISNQLGDSDSPILGEFARDASDVLSGYAYLALDEESIVLGLDDIGGGETGEAVEEVWDPLGEIDHKIIALREAEAKQAAARHREERIREMVMKRRELSRETGGGEGRGWGWGKT